MTREEAIKHCEEKACGNTECVNEHKQLAEWLKELQLLKSLSSNLDEAAEISDLEAKNLADDYTKFLAAGLTKNEPRPIGPRWIKKLVSDKFKAGAEWMAGQGVTKEAVIGMATEKIIISVSEQTLNELDLCPGDKVVVQIRKK